ncbi:MAG: LysR family transcriptional regulator [Betaproteobacteria bacterium]|nr:LysR family transcriptional regulator [Betaproteobacteria bacterium]
MAKTPPSRKSSKQDLRPQIRIMFRKAIAMGPGKADLLRAINETGSISAAARQMEMSYRRAWLLVDTMNQAFKSPVVVTLTGGKAGGGAAVTEFGKEVLRRYSAMEEKASASVARELRSFTDMMNGG